MDASFCVEKKEEALWEKQKNAGDVPRHPAKISNKRICCLYMLSIDMRMELCYNVNNKNR